MRQVTLRTRLTAWYTLALLIAVGLFGADVIWGEGRVGLRRVDRDLGSVASQVMVALNESPELASTETAFERGCHVATLPDTAVAILDARGPVVACHDGPPLPVPQQSSYSGRVVTSVPTPNGDWRVLTEPHVVGGQQLLIRVARPLSDVRRSQHEVLEAMEVAIPLVLLLAGGGGFWLASIGLRPISDMARAAAAMAPGATCDLGHANRNDELGQLARAFNGLLARLRASLMTQRRFMADASHELRTPVSVIRSASDVTLDREHRTETEYREALSITGAQARHLSRLVEQMLVLARADAGGYPLRFVDLYLDEVIQECQRTVKVMADAHGVTVTACAEGEVELRGDEELLRQLILNVLQNAVQHTPRSGLVTIRLELAGTDAIIRVSDTGSGVAPADQERIFERFVQLDPARRHLGAGLGLPIARWIAEAHGGSLVLEQSSRSGSTFRVVLPRSPRSIQE
jgi:signal transduction histidine kinase